MGARNPLTARYATRLPFEACITPLSVLTFCAKRRRLEFRRLQDEFPPSPKLRRDKSAFPEAAARQVRHRNDRALARSALSRSLMLSQDSKSANASRSSRLINNSAQARHAIKRGIRANHRLTVKAAEAGDPVIIFPKAVPDGGHLAVHVRCGLRDGPVQGVDFPPLEIIPGGRRIFETDGDFRQTDDRRADVFSAMLKQERPRRAPPALKSLVGKLNQECRVGYHLRPPDRRPR